MSSKAKRIANGQRERKINALVSVLSVLEESARKKSFGKRLRIACRYLFKKDFTAFFCEE